MQIILIFTLLQFINVILNTVKSVLTVQGTKFSASVSNALTYAFYTIIVKQVSELDLTMTVIVTAITNLIGVYVSLVIMNKFKKDKLWEIVVTLKNNYENNQKYLSLSNELQLKHIGHNYIETTDGNYFIFNIYSENQKDSKIIKNILNNFDVKYIVHEQSSVL